MTRLSEIRERHAAAILRANETHVVDSRDDDIGYLLNEVDWLKDDAEGWRWLMGNLSWLEDVVRRERAKQ